MRISPHARGRALRLIPLVPVLALAMLMIPLPQSGVPSAGDSLRPTGAGAPHAFGAPVVPSVVGASAAPAASNGSHPNGSWVRLGAVAIPTPGARAFASLVYDVSDRSLLLFGGWSSRSGPLGDTWEYAGGVWTNLTPSLRTSPTARYAATAAYDPYDGFVLLFGGITAAGTAGDAWTFAHGNWTPLSNAANVSPPARSSAGLANDRGAGSVVLFGGASATGAPLNDTWSYVAGGWKNLTGTIGASPPARSDATMSLDPVTGSVVLFGGVGACGRPCGDTWGLYDGAWTNLSSAVSPSPRSDATAMYDPITSALLLFGGRSTGFLNDTWRYGSTGWTNLTGSLTTAPAPSFASAAAFDPTDGYAVVVGGRTPMGLRAAVWAFIQPLTAKLQVSSAAIPPATAVVFTAQVVGGVGPYAVTIDPGDGSTPAYATVLTHTYTSTGTYNATMTTTDARGIVAKVHVAIVVSAYPLAVTLSLRPGISAPHEPTTITASVTGGAPPYSFAWTGLPPPCASSNSPTLTCAPATIGTFPVGLTVNDSAGGRVSAALKLTVVVVAGTTSAPLAPSASSSLLGRVGWNVVPAILAAMAMSAAAAYLMYRESKIPPPTAPELPARPMCYQPPEWSETPDDFHRPT